MKNNNFETAITTIIKTLNELIILESNLKRLQSLSGIVGEVGDAVDDYNNQTGRLHPDLGTDLSELLTLKEELVKSRTQGKRSYPEVVRRYNAEITAMLNSIEKDNCEKFKI